MGGIGSGRTNGRPTVEDSIRLDLATIIGDNANLERLQRYGTLHFTRHQLLVARIGFALNFGETLDLSCALVGGAGQRPVRQTLRLTFTRPRFGGKRWWLVCPDTGARVATLYLPPGGDHFASRKAWQLGYQSQRIGKEMVPFEGLFRLQRRLGCEIGWGKYPTRPKGMWSTTYARHQRRFMELNAQCTHGALGMLRRWNPDALPDLVLPELPYARRSSLGRI